MTEKAKTDRRRHVLVVDDNKELAQTYQQLLEAFGHRATTAGDGEAALQFIRENEVDAILCDISMPRLEGDQFYEAAERARPGIGRRFIFLTGHVNHPRFGPFLKSGKVRVLYKPVPIANLLEALKALMAETAGK